MLTQPLTLDTKCIHKVQLVDMDQINLCLTDKMHQTLFRFKTQGNLYVQCSTKFIVNHIANLYNYYQSNARA